MRRISKIQGRNDISSIPPFVDTIMKCASWGTLCRKILPDYVYKRDKRSTNLPLVFDNPVICRLYDALYAGTRNNYARNIASEYWNYVKQYPDDVTILEIGCGPGTILLRLAEIARENDKKINFIGCDISPEMIYLAEHHLCDYQYNNVSFFVSNGRNKRKLLGSLKKANLLITRNVLSWIKEPDLDISFWKKSLSNGANWISREVRRDISFNQFKRRLLEACQFSLDGQLLAYPADAFLISYLRAFTAKEHNTLLNNHFNTVNAFPVKSCLISDLGKADAAESQFVCTREGRE